MCPDEIRLIAFVRCEISDAEHAEVESHLSVCAACRKKVEEWERGGVFGGMFFSTGTSPSELRRANEKLDAFLDRDVPLPLPMEMGAYRLLEPLGRGGMGDLYLAEHRVLKRRVAVKLIRQKRLENLRAVERFQKEILAAGKLVHPNIVTATDAGSFDGTPYLVMELLLGQTLGAYTRLSGGKLRPKEAREILLSVARALRFAHEQGFVHCDVKPSNLWRTDDGTIKVLDFGLAHSMEELDAGETHVLAGTPDFLPPEQTIPNAVVDGRADIYSLGCVLFYLLTGKTASDCLRENLSFPDVRAANVRITPTLQKLLCRMTEYSPSRRPRDMAEVISILERAESPRWPIFVGGTLLFGAAISGFFWLKDAPPDTSKKIPPSEPQAVVLPESKRPEEKAEPAAKTPTPPPEAPLETPKVPEPSARSDWKISRDSHLEAMVQQAEQCFREGNRGDENFRLKKYRKAMDLLEEASEKGNWNAVHLRWQCWRQNVAIPVPADALVAIMQAAAEQEIPEAMLAMGKYYWEGRFTPRDEEKAISWFQKGSESDGSSELVAECVYYLGKACLTGECFPKNPSSARRFFKKSNNDAAKFELGKMAMERPLPDLSAAYKYFFDSKNYPESCYMLGYFYETGKIGSPSIDAAMTFYPVAVMEDCDRQKLGEPPLLSENGVAGYPSAFFRKNYEKFVADCLPSHP